MNTQDRTGRRASDKERAAALEAVSPRLNAAIAALAKAQRAIQAALLARGYKPLPSGNK